MQTKGKENFQCELSIIIVNYNVEYFLEQCLNSVYAAIKNLSAEVFVVDNNSIDHSVEMVKEKFPQVNLIANKDNPGFSKANNQAIKIAKGKYILLLNPDTVVEEDTFSKCINFMNDHPDAGGLGVRMIDGKGNFLPESKRGLPTPSVAFYKIFGISRLFPKSKKFGKYHLGYLNEYEINEIEVLSGAFMLMRKETLDKVGLLDETFFMYGEDIDLSYRIILGGYKNYYFPKTQIIHYKGESTKKSSINYVFVFYRAMIIFAEKHFSSKNAGLFSLLINLAIYFRASLAVLSRFIKKSILPIIDFSLLFILLILNTKIWETESINFPSEIINIAIPGYLLTWMVFILYSGGYDKPLKIIKITKGILFGTLSILAIYALLPKEFQFSRLYIILGALTVLSYYIFSRYALHYLLGSKFQIGVIKNKTFVIIGSFDEIKRVEKILKSTTNKIQEILYVSPNDEEKNGYIGSINQLNQIVDIHKVNEIIFCARDNSAESIINWMSRIGNDQIEFKIAQPESFYLIGSNSVDSSGDLYLLEIDKISEKSSKRNKRTFDFFMALFLLIAYPIIFLFYKNKLKLAKNLWSILLGKMSFVGYNISVIDPATKLPKLKPGIFTPFNYGHNEIKPNKSVHKMNLLYAKDYNVSKDFKIFWKNKQQLDR